MSKALLPLLGDFIITRGTGVANQIKLATTDGGIIKNDFFYFVPGKIFNSI